MTVVPDVRSGLRGWLLASGAIAVAVHLGAREGLATTFTFGIGVIVYAFVVRRALARGTVDNGGDST